MFYRKSGVIAKYGMRHLGNGGAFFLFKWIDFIERLFVLRFLPVFDKLPVMQSGPLDNKTHNTRR